MKRKILNEQSLDINIQSNFNEANTVYVIQTNTNLNGSTITIPSDCTLEFEGGIFSNGSIRGNKTRIIAKTGKIFININFDGTWWNDYVDIRWFGALGDNLANDYSAIKAALNSGWKSIKIPSGTFRIEDVLEITLPGLTIWGNGVENTSICSIKGVSVFSVKSNYIKIKNISFKSTAEGYPCMDLTTAKANVGVSVEEGINNICISKCMFEGFTMGIICQCLNENVLVSECVFSNMKFIPEFKDDPQRGGAGGYGVVFQHIDEDNIQKKGTKNYVVEKCLFENTIYRHSIYTQSSSGRIFNNTFYGDSTKYITQVESRLLVLGSDNAIIENNIFDGGIFAVETAVGRKEDNLSKNVIITNNQFKNFVQVRYSNSIVKLEYAQNCIVANNIFTNNQGMAINVSSYTTDAIICNNNIHTQKYAGPNPNTGIDPKVVSHGIVAFSNTGDTASSIEIHDNIIEIDPQEINGSCIYFELSSNFHDLYIKNNIFKNGDRGIFFFKPSALGTNITIFDSFIENNVKKNIRNEIVRIDNIVNNVKVSNNNGTIKFGNYSGITECYGNYAVTCNENFYLYKNINYKYYRPIKEIYSNTIPKLTGQLWNYGDRVIIPEPANLTCVGYVCTYGGNDSQVRWMPYGQIITGGDKLNYGLTSERPKNAPIGFMYFDYTLKKMILWNGSAWVNVTGTPL